MELYNLGYSLRSITDALYKAALIVKDKSDAAIKKQQAKAKAQAAASTEAAAKRGLKAEDAKRSAERAQNGYSKAAEKTKKQGSTQPQKIDLKNA
jgi:hypothetical protein